MESYLFIAEKPSLMLEVKKCYSKHKQEIMDKIGSIDFIALAGHVCRNSEPNDYEEWSGPWDAIDYPMIPKTWKIEAANDPKKKAILKSIKNTIDDYDGVIVGTDSDVEGYGIYYLTEHFLGIQDKKALRFIEHSLTDKEILQSLLDMTDYHEDTVHKRFVQSYLVRSRADWLYGMNGTRKLSVRQETMLAVGRVKAPTIKLVYDNSMAIENFKVKKYYQVESDYGGFTATLLDKDGKIAKFDDKSSIKSYPLQGTVNDVKTERVYEHAPKLYNLSALQSDAGKKFKYSPAETLEIAQSLYEKHKVISYPRTQCRYASKEKANEFPMMLSHMDVFPNLAQHMGKVTDSVIQAIKNDKSVVNDKEVEKESHDVILPTSVRPDLSNMTQKEQNICKMVFTRLLAQFLPKAEDDKTSLTILHGDGLFSSSGKVVAEQGCRVLYAESKDKTLPKLSKGDTITAKKIEPVEKKTSPPKRLTQATLLDSMMNIANTIEDAELRKSLAESKGIGTPATRAKIITDIIGRGYVEEQKSGLYITGLGKQYICAVEPLEISSPVFAAIMDTEMKKVQRGEANYDEVYGKVLHGLYDMCSQIDNIKSLTRTTSAKCPVCGGEIKIGRFRYECSGCDFKMQKNVCGKEIDEKLLEKLVSGEVSNQYNFKKKDGTAFKAKLKIENNELVFDFSSGISCPKCKEKDVVINKGGAFCACGLRIFRKIAGKELTDSELKELLKNGILKNISGFIGKSGKPFTASVVLKEDGTTEFQFDNNDNLFHCPLCQNESVKINKGGAFCNCGLKIFRNMAGHSFSDKELESLLAKGRTKQIQDFTSKSGKEFSASVILVDGKTQFDFGN